ncbi:S1C family serine protease [Metabacillus fastidiosus]|uniref:Trypsin-like peptidase domain-containing protein n=1 Tax=Metabacillus fastidiosus TaxID=1458 RepID=A0ABU6P1I9_9BACI|nr:trypsin-like peptidase domain-containing protein [Metabacillus fastidiosus]MED4402940.1 trypsin-like peptidase domain-containing protein [Metabacillus fastidiosus]MED4454271.1 trypsin-like peptidase domain-containing protein [Metabacillus fastidiosus]MED4461358.1 trypsin-like peptidase domain-containing protein [Metabacillus fastidiosus]
MGYYDEFENAKYENKKKGTGKTILTSLISGALGGALVLGVMTFNEDEQQPGQEAAISQAKNYAEEASVPVATKELKAGGSIADIVDSLSPAIIGITNMQQSSSFFDEGMETVEAGTGSGVIFKQSGKDAFIITNNHVIEGSQAIEVTLHNGEKVSAELIGTDPLTDIAVLKIDSKNVKAIAKFGDSSKLRTGENVIAIGNPLGLDLYSTVTQGIISGKDRTINTNTSEGTWGLNVLQTDAAINPGNSGGPLINMSGEVIGINTLKIGQTGVEGIGFAVPSNDVMQVAGQLLETGKVQRPFLGVGLRDVSEFPQYQLQENIGLPENMTEGVIIASVSPNSPAQVAGLQKLDVITAIDGEEVKTTNDLRRLLYTSTNIGDEIKVKFYRGKEQKTVTVKLTSKDATNA